MQKEPIGLYLHVPFCASKCPYCDFYSMRTSEEEMERYTFALQKQMKESYKALSRKANTLYIGGGTPSLLGAERLKSLIKTAKETFLLENSEITVECNPYGLTKDFLEKLYACGVRRISLGMQSAIEKERKKLGRRAGREEIATVIQNAKAVGFQNITVDVMLGIPYQTAESLSETLDFALAQDIPHVSVYLLKLEEGTPFYKMRKTLPIADDDTAADFYLQTVETLEQHGLMQYEISNFAKLGYESRHNLKYWYAEEYLGLGPSAHSFINGKRFYFPRDLADFYAGKPPIADGTGGDFLEYAMLSLRLSKGLSNENVEKRFHHAIPPFLLEKAKKYEAMGFLEMDTEGIRLLPKGFLMSNAILADLLDDAAMQAFAESL